MIINLKQKTNLNINLVADDDLNADILIIVHSIPPRHVSILGDRLRDWEKSLHTKIKFTSKERYGVQGFFLSNGSNEIQKAYCYISPTDIQMAKPENNKIYMQECILRSLGLPEPIIQPESINYPISVLTAIKSHEAYQNLSKENPATDFMPLDIKLINTLYCEAIKAGDDANQVIFAIMTSDVCTFGGYQ